MRSFTICDSFALTESYIVFMEQPLKIDLRKYQMLILLGKPFSEMFNWNPKENVRFIIILLLMQFHDCMCVQYYAGKILCH